jgi:hypothetical protein
MTLVMQSSYDMASCHVISFDTGLEMSRWFWVGGRRGYNAFLGGGFMKILAIEKYIPGLTDEDFTPHVKAEAIRAWELYQSGTFREIYFRQDEEISVIILECENVDEANEVLNTLPLVKAGLSKYEIIPLVPYPDFSLLFADPSPKSL